jgi:hypothetical protein
MNFPTRNGLSNESGASAAEETLRLIAHLPVPEGIEDRVLRGLQTRQSTARVLAWPTALRAGGNWMRSAAAAAIVFVVAGGGWGIYSRVQQSQPANAAVQQPYIAPSRGFSSAGAMRAPQSLNGPVVAAHPVTVPPGQMKAPKANPRLVKPNPRGKTARAGNLN